MLIPYMRTRCMPLLFGFKKYLNHGDARLCSSLICVDLAFPDDFGLKII